MEFAGWEMPVQYDGVREEHMAVREACGIFDVSHMGEIETRGPEALALLQRLLSNDVAGDRRSAARSTACSAARTAACSTTCSPTGSSADRYLTVTNAVQPRARPRLVPRARGGLRRTSQVRDRIDDWAMLAVQGPLAREIVQAISDAPLPRG